MLFVVAAAQGDLAVSFCRSPLCPAPSLETCGALWLDAVLAALLACLLQRSTRNWLSNRQSQGLKLDTDIAALMAAEAAEAAAGGDAETPPAAQQAQQEEQQAPVSAQQQQAQQEEEEEPESMVDFLLRRQMSPAPPDGPTSSAGSAGSSGAAGSAGTAGMPDVPPPSAWNSVGPLRCWHPVGSGEVAVAHIARRLASMEVRALAFGITLRWQCMQHAAWLVE